ncbi:hypothetical protein RF11_06291 [Thelohanellus kitauei]|uniref:Uncharacterized protein n=1 Tax=Thelohanellus kitauei TaxID=669202 RepID=A0A0C2MVB3_THEKT|nr:hypothetical protein RF11_06291 [Thelohanellus kitauei]
MDYDFMLPSDIIFVPESILRRIISESTSSVLSSTNSMKNRRSPSDERSIPPNIHCCLSNLPTPNFCMHVINKVFDAEVSAESGPINNGLLREIKVLLDEDERVLLRPKM